MTLLSTLILSITLAFSIILAASPLFLGLWVLFLALSLSLVLTVLSYSWLGLFIFLIYVGGLLVMFAYFVALAPNHLLERKSIFFLAFATYPALFFILGPNTLILTSDFSSNAQSPLTALLLEHSIPIYIFLALVLFLALIAVVKVRTVSSGPLRPYS